MARTKCDDANVLKNLIATTRMEKMAKLQSTSVHELMAKLLGHMMGQEVSVRTMKRMAFNRSVNDTRAREAIKALRDKFGEHIKFLEGAILAMDDLLSKKEMSADCTDKVIGSAMENFKKWIAEAGDIRKKLENNES